MSIMCCGYCGFLGYAFHINGAHSLLDRRMFILWGVFPRAQLHTSMHVGIDFLNPLLGWCSGMVLLRLRKIRVQSLAQPWTSHVVLVRSLVHASVSFFAK